MKKYILIPDSFKGSMSSKQVCGIMEKSIHKALKDAFVVSIPVADGGEGSLDAFLSALGGEKIKLTVSGPYFQKTEAFYAYLPSKTAVVELAQASGLTLVGDKKHAEKTTTYGTGEIIKHALQNGAEKIIICLGGSSTNDGGAGLLCAMGVKFKDKSGKEFIPTGESLSLICDIDTKEAKELLGETPILIMCDVDNPLCGENGAAHVFAPQKGATEETVKMLDEGLLHFAKVIKEKWGADISDKPGAGAAGGAAGGIYALLGGEMKSGIETILEITNFDKQLENCDAVFTGEGRFDSQTLRGKVIKGVLAHTKKANVPLIAVAGEVKLSSEILEKEGIYLARSTNRFALPFKKAKLRCEEDLEYTMDEIMKELI